MKIENTFKATLDSKEYIALKDLLCYVFEQMSEKKRNNFFDKEELQTLDDMYMSI